MSKSKISAIGITMGDPSGIGPEVIAKSLLKPSLRKLAHFMIIGDYGIFRRYLPGRLNHCSFLDLKNVSPDKFHLGTANRHGAKASLEYLHKAMELIRKKEIRAL